MAGAIDFLPVGPDAVSQREHLAREIQKQARNPGAAIDVNPLSLVIALECNMGGQRFAALLAADTDEKGTDRALDLWARRAREGRRAEAFDVVKLSHHGSLASHNDRLCVEPGRERAPGLAAICCGTRAALPDREVIRRFQTAGWKVFATMTRRTPARVARRPHRDLPMELSDRSRFTVRMPNLHHVQIRWSPKSGVSAIPRSAAIRKRDLDQYETANE